MNYIDKVLELIDNIARGVMCENYDNLNKAVELVTEILGWKPMGTVPKDRPILVWAYSSAEWWKFNLRQRTCFPVKWDNVWDRWIVLGGADDGSGQPFIALDPIAWMEIFEYDAS